MGYKYKPLETYFDSIDCEYKAYILGFIFADGSITQPKGNRQLRLQVTVQEKDGYILQKLSNDVINRELLIHHPPSIAKRGWKKRSSVSIISNNLCRRLVDLGCNINKTVVGLNFPKIEKCLIPHFIRGFIDGNGSIIMKKQTKRNSTYTHLKIAITSTDKNFLEEIIKYLPINKVYFAEKHKDLITYTLWIERKEDVKNTIKYLYKNASYFLSRKYDKVLEFNKIIKSQAEDISSEGLETT